MYDFDVVLGSIHKPKGLGYDIKEIDFTKIDVYEFMENYFSEIIEMTKSPLVDVIAHITCPMRHIIGKYNIDFDYSKISSITDKLLKSIVVVLDISSLPFLYLTFISTFFVIL